MSLLNFLRRSSHVDAPKIVVPVAPETRMPCQVDPQLLAEAGLPPWLSTEEALEALAPAPEVLRSYPEPIVEEPNFNVFTPATVLAPTDEIVLPVTYSEEEHLQEMMLFSEQEALRFPVIKRHRPHLGLGLSFDGDALLTNRGSANWLAVPLQDVIFDMVIDRSPNQTRVNNTELYVGASVPTQNVKTTRYNFSWFNYGIVAQFAGRLYEPATYANPLTLAQVMVNQALDNPKAAEYLPEPELYLGFNDAETVWDVILPALNCINSQQFSIQPSKKQLDYVESQILQGMPVYANATGVVKYIPWKKQASVDIYIETDEGRIFAGCVPEFGKYYIAEGTEVHPGQLLAAGFPQQADLDGDGQVDSPSIPFVAGQKLAMFLSDNGGFKNVIMTVMKNSMRKYGEVIVAPFDTVSRLVERAVPELALLVWQKNCHTPSEIFQVDEKTERLFGVLPHKARRHGFGMANRGISRDGLVISSAEQ